MGHSTALVGDGCPLTGGGISVRDRPPVEKLLGDAAVHRVVGEGVDIVIVEVVLGQVAHRITCEGPTCAAPRVIAEVM